ncbi:MAG: glycosyltransferase family 1 protein [Bryobacterales bacterium]
MRIGVDGGCWTNRRGYGRYLRELVAALARIDRSNEYVVFLDSGADTAEPWPAPFEPRFVPTRVETAQAARADGRRSIPDLLRMSHAVARERFDVFFFPSVYSYFPLFGGSPALVGVHDTIAENFPQHAFASRSQERNWRAKVRLALWQARRCLTVSEHSRRSIERVYGFPAARIDVVHEAAAAVFAPSREPREDFILYAGGISPSKNLPVLVEAFACMKECTPETQLVLAGDYRGDRFRGCHDEIVAQVQSLELGERVRFTGFIPDSELASLYRRARLFAMPSFDEGFGLPAVEAMACGAPVVVSSGNALEEVVGDAGLTAAASDVAALARAMDRIFADQALAAELSAKAIAQSSRFSWDQTARGVLAALERTRQPG